MPMNPYSDPNPSGSHCPVDYPDPFPVDYPDPSILENVDAVDAVLDLHPGGIFPVVYPSPFYNETCIRGALVRKLKTDPNYNIDYEGFAGRNADIYKTVPKSELMPHYKILAEKALEAYHDFFGTERQYEFKSVQKVVCKKSEGLYYLTFNIMEKGSADHQAMQAIMTNFGIFVLIHYVSIMT